MLVELREAENRGTVWVADHGQPGGVWLNDWGSGNEGPAPLRPLAAAVAGNLSLLKKLNSEITDMKTSGTYSDAGIAEKIADAAKERVGPEWQRLEREIQRTTGYADGEEIRLSKPEIDKTDVASAVLRSNIRSYFSDLPEVQRRAQLLQDLEPVVLTALLEAPVFLVGLDSEMLTKLRSAHMEAISPGKTAEMETLRSAAKSASALMAATQGSLVKFTAKPKQVVEELLRMSPMRVV